MYVSLHPISLNLPSSAEILDSQAATNSWPLEIDPLERYMRNTSTTFVSKAYPYGTHLPSARRKSLKAQWYFLVRNGIFHVLLNTRKSAEDTRWQPYGVPDGFRTLDEEDRVVVSGPRPVLGMSGWHCKSVEYEVENHGVVNMSM